MPDYTMLVREVVELRAGLRRLEAAEPPINVAAGKTLKVEHSMTLTGADGRVLTIPETGTAALLATAQTFTQTQAISTTGTETLILATSGSSNRFNLRNDTRHLFDGNNADGSVLRWRIEHTTSTNLFSIQVRGTSGIIQFSTGNSGGTLTEAMRVTAAQNVLINTTTDAGRLTVNGDLAIVDGMTAPSAISGFAKIYVDSADGDLKVRFGDGTIKTIVTDT